MKRYLIIIVAGLMVAISLASCFRWEETTTMTTTTTTTTTVQNPPVSEGLEFKLNEDGQSYSVIGVGTYTGTELVIPAQHNGLPVTVIGSCAFRGCSFTKVIIPEGVNRIEGQAFYNATINSIVIPESVTYIGATAGESAFYGSDVVEVENGLYYVGDWLVGYDWYANMDTVIIREGTIGIGNQALIFNPCEEIIIPESVKYICETAFYMQENLDRIYYLGTSNQWSQISIDYNLNDVLKSDIVCFDSESQP